MASSTEELAPAGYHYVYCAGFVHSKTGKYISAASCGKKCFRFLVKDR